MHRFATYVASAAAALTLAAPADGRIAVSPKHSGIYQIQAPFSNESAVDLYTLMQMEGDRGGPIEVNIRLYASDFDRHDLLPEIVSWVADFYEQTGVRLRFEYADKRFTADDTAEGAEHFNVVLASGTDFFDAAYDLFRRSAEYIGTEIPEEPPAGGYGDALSRTAMINTLYHNDALGSAGIRNGVAYAALLGRAAAHELGHAAGLPHPHDLELWHLVPEFIDACGGGDGSGLLPNIMGYRFVYDAGNPSVFPAGLSDFQADQLRSSLAGGVAYRELSADCFDDQSFMARMRTGERLRQMIEEQH